MVHTKLKDRRNSIRYPIQLLIELVLEDGTTLSIETINISRSGLQFYCDSWVANKIEPRGIHNHPLDHIRLKIIAELPIPDENKLCVHCLVVFAQRLSQEEYIIGMDFSDFDGSGEKVLEQFINSRKKTN